MEVILRIFPAHLREMFRMKLQNKWTSLEEIRLRLHQPIELIFHHKVEWLDDHTLFQKDDSLYVLNQLSEHSLYRMEKELQEGYITIEGGHRIGLAGKVTLKNNVDAQLHRITFYNIRIAKEVIGVAAPIIPYLYEQQTVQNTLIIGPPKTGKTTIIRDVARLISSGVQSYEPAKVGVIDERSEIAAAMEGVPQHQVGSRTDVMDACPKVTGMMMMIRSMSPEVLIMDEIGKEADVHAMMEAILSGVSIICTIHGQSLPSILKRPSMQQLFHHNVFSRIITLSTVDYHSIKVEVMNAKGKEIASHLIMKQ